jgi:hypothetical protein
MTTAHASVRPLCCRGACASAAEHPEHHDRLLTVDSCVDAVLELLEMAVTWHELDWSGTSVVGPEHWLTFAGEHDWADPERAERVFILAADVVGRAAAGPPPENALAAVIELVRS